MSELDSAGLHLAAIGLWADLGPLEVPTCEARIRENVLAMGLPAPLLDAEPR